MCLMMNTSVKVHAAVLFVLNDTPARVYLCVGSTCAHDPAFKKESRLKTPEVLSMRVLFPIVA